MSCRQWESGKVVIPAKEWSKFRTGLMEAWNRHQRSVLEDAKRTYPLVKAAVKGIGRREHESVMRDVLVRAFRGADDRIEEVEDLIGGRVWDEERQCWVARLRAPRKKNLKIVATTKDAVIDMSEARITFTNKTRTVTWDVAEDNHACDRTHSHWFAKRLFEALGRVRWTRGSGGTIVGNDEYNQQSCEEGGGANYVTYEFGPKVKKTGRLNRGYYNY